ncbi:MAG: enoyl-CoA hydratase/isomerase family protein [Candidatus Acidiferrum sp.]
MFETLILTFSGDLATLTLNRPEKRNAISAQTLVELAVALDAIERSSARVGMITGAGKAFCSGMDLEMLSGFSTRASEENREVWCRVAELFRRIWTFPKPLLAAVNGAAVAGGCGIATLCDFTLAAPEAQFGYPEVRIGFVPSIVSVFLPRQIGDKHARDLLLSGRIINAEEAKDLGLVNEVVSLRNLLERARSLAEELRAASPNSVSRTKHLLTSASAAALDAELEHAISENTRICKSADFKEGLAAFLGKRKPTWRRETQ